MRVLITGGSGLLGMALVTKFRNLGDRVTSIYFRNDSSLLYPDVRYVQADLTKQWQCDKAVAGQDYVFHCAAVVAGAAGMDKGKIDLITPNVKMNVSLLRAAYEAGVKRFMFFSSTTVYPDTKNVPVKENGGFVGEPYDKYFDVGWVKRYSEKLCESYTKKGMPCIVLRPSNIYGPYDKFDPAISHVTPALIKKVVDRQNPLEIWGDGTEKRDMIYVGDMADACELAMDKIDTYDPINIGSGKCYSVNDILDALLSLENFKPDIVYKPDKPTMIPVRYLDVQKAEELLDFRAKTPLTVGLYKTMRWYKESIIKNDKPKEWGGFLEDI